MKKGSATNWPASLHLYVNAGQTPGLRSLDSLLFGFATAVVGWSFAVIGFFDFMSWFCHWIVSRMDRGI